MATLAADNVPAFDPVAEEAVDESLASAARREGPWDYYRQLRERAPVYYSRSRGMWFLTGYRAVESILKSSAALLEFEKRMDTVRPDWRDHPSNANVAPFIAFVDGEAHQKIRKPFSPKFTPKEMERFRPAIRAIAEEHVDRYIEAGGGRFADLVAFPFAERVLCHLFAFDKTKLPNARDLVHRMQIGFELDATPEQLADADEASREYRTFWQGEFAQRVGDWSGNDMFSDLLRDDSFTREEIGLIAESIFSGGFDSTALTMTTGAWLLASHPEEIDRARNDPEAMARIPEEVLRMGSGIPMTIRVSTRPIEIEGYLLPTDSVIGVVLAGANRDPAIFADPERFDLTRAPYRVMSFSYGAHACLGQWTARIEIFEIFRALISRSKSIRLVGDPIFRDRQSVRGVEDVVLAVT